MKLLANLGDASPLEYGGLLVIEDDNGGAHIEVWEEPNSNELISIYRLDIDTFTYVNGVLSDNPYHPDKPVWFADKLRSIAECNGCEVDELIRMFLSDDPVQRVEGYREVASYYGWYEFDQEPLGMSVGKAAWRYREFNLGEVPYKYKLLDQIKEYCRGQLDRIEKAPPAESDYFRAYRSGETAVYEDVMIELGIIENSWD